MVWVFSIVIALLPSLIWLGLFLREDVHPEPNRIIRRVFIAGMLITIPTLLIQTLFHCIIPRDVVSLFPIPFSLCNASPLAGLSTETRQILFLFIGIAFIEEFMKYLAVRFTVLRDPNFDEPVDALLYLVIAGLGFAAVENALTVSNADVQSIGLFGAGGVLTILGARSLSATLLHTLASGIVGYFLARSFFTNHPRHYLVFVGLLIASLVHGAYNGIVGKVFGGATADATIGNVILLLIVTGAVLLGLLKHLRVLSARHRWQNLGDAAEEIA